VYFAQCVTSLLADKGVLSIDNSSISSSRSNSSRIEVKVAEVVVIVALIKFV